MHSLVLTYVYLQYKKRNQHYTRTYEYTVLVYNVVQYAIVGIQYTETYTPHVLLLYVY